MLSIKHGLWKCVFLRRKKSNPYAWWGKQRRLHYQMYPRKLYISHDSHLLAISRGILFSLELLKREKVWVLLVLQVDEKRRKKKRKTTQQRWDYALDFFFGENKIFTRLRSTLFQVFLVLSIRQSWWKCVFLGRRKSNSIGYGESKEGSTIKCTQAGCTYVTSTTDFTWNIIFSRICKREKIWAYLSYK